MLSVSAHEFMPLPFVEIEKVITQDGISHLLHQPMIERQIVDGQEMPAQDLVGLDEMVQVGARVVPASLTAAMGVDRPLRKLMHGSAQLNLPLRGENDAALRELGGDDAVEHVDAAMNGFQQIDRRAHAHEIARQMRRKMIR